MYVCVCVCVQCKQETEMASIVCLSVCAILNAFRLHCAMSLSGCQVVVCCCMFNDQSNVFYLFKCFAFSSTESQLFV